MSSYPQRWARKFCIPEGLVIDHLCHNRDSSCPGARACMHRRCVNPDHLEPTTIEENQRRGIPRSRRGGGRAVWTHCKHGHEFTPENTIVYTGHPTWRICRTCRNEYYWKKKAV